MGGIAAMAAAAARKRRHTINGVAAQVVDEAFASVCSETEEDSGAPDIYEDNNPPHEGISIEGCASIDSDMSFSTSQVPLQHKSSTLSTTSSAYNDPMSGITHIVRPIVKRATRAQMSYVVRQLVEDNEDAESSDSEGSALQTVNSQESNMIYETSYKTPPKPEGRRTFNSSVLRPKAIPKKMNDESQSELIDEDQVGELPNRQSKKRGKVLNDLEDDLELTMIESKDSNESDMSYGTIHTIDTIQSYARKTSQVFDSLTHRLSGEGRSNVGTSSTKNEEDENEPLVGSRPSLDPMGMGEIATQAAKAALKRNQDKELEYSSLHPLAGNGIADLAAAAARKRNKHADDLANSAHDCRDDDSTSSLSTKSIGLSGIADQAAPARIKSVPNDSDMTGTMLGGKDDD